MAAPARNIPSARPSDHAAPLTGGPRATRGMFSPEEIARLRRRWWIPVLAAVLVAGAVYASMMAGVPQYSAQATMELFSKDKTPAEVTVLASGYVDYFNQPASQSGIRQQAGLDPSATLGARMAASGPIVYITATAPDRQVAQDAANNASKAFRAQMNRSLTSASTAHVARSSKTEPTTLDVLQNAQGASTVTQSKARAALPWAGGAFLVALVAVVFVPGRRRQASRTAS